MRYLSVCSGIEAASVAWHPLGWEPAAFCEIEAFPSAVLAHHYPNVPNYGDFTRLSDATHPIHDAGIDLLVGGTPCQAFSVAGLRRGLADPRGGLTLEFVRLAQALRPKWVVWENVPGVLSQDGGGAFGSFLGALVELGYGWAYRVLDAQYVRVDGYPHAVPQRRRRVFVVGCAGGDFARAAAVLLEPEGVRGDPPTRRATREGAAPDAAGGVDVAGCLQHRDSKGVDSDTKPGHILPVVPYDLFQITAPINRQNRDERSPCHTLARDNAAHAAVVIDAERQVCPTLTSRMQGSSGWAPYNEDAHLIPQASMSVRRLTPTECEHAAVVQPLAFDARQSDTIIYGDRKGPLDTDGHTVGVCVTGDRTHALTASGDGATEDGTGRGNPIVNAGMSVRRLTPTECERLQGFPDGHTAIPWKGKAASECPDGPRYRALGNSMAVNVMRWIGRRIELVEKT